MVKIIFKINKFNFHYLLENLVGCELVQELIQIVHHSLSTLKQSVAQDKVDTAVKFVSQATKSFFQTSKVINYIDW